MTMTMSVDMPDSFSIELRSLLAGLLQRDVHKRLGCRGRGAEEIKSHPFFRGIDWRTVLLQRLSPPLIPARGEVNAADAFDIGSFDDEDTKHIRLTDADQELYRNFPVVVSERWQQEIAETIFDYINHEADKCEMKRKNKNKLGYQEEEQSDCILHGYMKRLGGTFTATWLTRYVRLYPNRLELWSDSGKQPELIFMDQMEEVCSDFVQIKNEQCIVIKLYSHTKYVLTNSDEIGLKEWLNSLKAAHKESVDMMTRMADKATKIYGTEIPLKHMGKRRQQLLQEAATNTNNSTTNNSSTNSNSNNNNHHNNSNSSNSSLAGQFHSSCPSSASSSTSGSGPPTQLISSTFTTNINSGAISGANTNNNNGANTSAHNQQQTTSITSSAGQTTTTTNQQQSPPITATTTTSNSSKIANLEQKIIQRELEDSSKRRSCRNNAGERATTTTTSTITAADRTSSGGQQKQPTTNAMNKPAGSSHRTSSSSQASGSHASVHAHAGHSHHRGHHHRHHHHASSQVSGAAGATGAAHPHHHHHHHHHHRGHSSSTRSHESSSSAGPLKQPPSSEQQAGDAKVEEPREQQDTANSMTPIAKVGDTADAGAEQKAPLGDLNQAQEEKVSGDKLTRKDVTDTSAPVELGDEETRKLSASSAHSEDQANNSDSSTSFDDSQSSCRQSSESSAASAELQGPAQMHAQQGRLASVAESSATEPTAAANPEGAAVNDKITAAPPLTNEDNDDEDDGEGTIIGQPAIKLALSLETVSEHQEVLRDPSKRITSDNKQREQDLVAQYEKLNISAFNSSSSIEE